MPYDAQVVTDLSAIPDDVLEQITVSVDLSIYKNLDAKSPFQSAVSSGLKNFKADSFAGFGELNKPYAKNGKIETIEYTIAFGDKSHYLSGEEIYVLPLGLLACPDPAIREFGAMLAGRVLRDGLKADSLESRLMILYLECMAYAEEDVCAMVEACGALSHVITNKTKRDPKDFDILRIRDNLKTGMELLTDKARIGGYLNNISFGAQTIDWRESTSPPQPHMRPGQIPRRERAENG